MHNSNEFEKYGVVREGLRWKVTETLSSGIVVDLHPVVGRFWRKVNAERTARCLLSAWAFGRDHEQ